MKFTINKGDILGVLSRIQGLISRSSGLAITENVLIRTVSSGVMFTATDLETGFEGSYPAEIEREGIIAINGKKFYEIARDFPSDDICIDEIENRWIRIGNEKVEYHIASANPEDFPDVIHFEEVDFFKIEMNVLKNMIEKTAIIHADSKEKRAHILGVYFDQLIEENEKIVRMVSTDGNRMALVEHRFDREVDLKDQSGVLIPKKGLSDAGKFLEDEGLVDIGFKENNFIVKKDLETITVRLLEGAFPEYAPILERSEEHEIKVDRSTFLMMLKRMSILSTEDYRGVIFNFDENKLVINTTNPDIGESKEDMAIAFEREPVEASFNPKFFIDTLNAIEDDVVVMTIVDEERPCFIQGDIDKTYLSVIMPMRI